jgi:hypothetical protein
MRIAKPTLTASHGAHGADHKDTLTGCEVVKRR